MKRTAVILLICIYSFATMGFSIKQFYCCGKLKSVSLTIVSDAEPKCGKGNKKGGCCDNKIQFVKVKDKHVASDQTGSPVKHFIDLSTFFCTAQVHTSTSKIILVAYRGNAPPEQPGVPIYIINRVFRI